MQLKPINQQVVVVFGASSGMGRAAALEFARRGAKIVVSARGAEALHTLVDEIRSAGGTATPVVADAADAAQVQALADEAVRQYGQLDTWVHLPAVAIWGRFEDTSPEEFRRIIDVDLNGQAYGAMAALPHLRRTGGGALIHISSVEAKRAFPLQSAYAAAKHGVDGFLEALRMELMHDNVPISVTNIMPASINTPFFNKARSKIGVKPAAPPPIYAPQLVVDAILYAAEHPVRDMVVGGAGKAIIMGQALAPGLLDQFFSSDTFYNFLGTEEPRPPGSPDNLYQPLPNEQRIEGDFSEHMRQRSLYPALEMRPNIWRALAAGTIGAALLLAGRSLRR